MLQKCWIKIGKLIILYKKNCKKCCCVEMLSHVPHAFIHQIVRKFTIYREKINHKIFPFSISSKDCSHTILMNTTLTENLYKNSTRGSLSCSLYWCAIPSTSLLILAPAGPRAFKDLGNGHLQYVTLCRKWFPFINAVYHLSFMNSS